MKPGSLIIQGANSRGYPKDEANQTMDLFCGRVFLFEIGYTDLKKGIEL